MNAIRIPVVDENQRLDRQAIRDLPEYLSDGDDRRVCRQLLKTAWKAALPATTTVGAVAEMLEKSDPGMRRFFLEGAEKISGVAEERAEREREELERANRARLANRPSRPVFVDGKWRDLQEEELEAQRIQSELASRAAAREHEQAQRRAEAEQARIAKKRGDAARRQLLPEHLR
jgi:hypothetical protein